MCTENVHLSVQQGALTSPVAAAVATLVGMGWPCWMVRVQAHICARTAILWERRPAVKRENCAEAVVIEKAA